MSDTTTPATAPAPCEVCGHNCNTDAAHVRVYHNADCLALLCIRCHAAGVLWAARQAQARMPRTGPRR